MLIKIFDDVFDVVKRLKEIDSHYFVVFNTQRNCFEVHSSSQKQTFCLSVPFKTLDFRTVELTRKTRRENFDKIMKEIDDFNENLEKENQRKINDLTSWKGKEIFDFVNRHEQKDFENAYVTKWA